MNGICYTAYGQYFNEPIIKKTVFLVFYLLYTALIFQCLLGVLDFVQSFELLILIVSTWWQQNQTKQEFLNRLLDWNALQSVQV